MRKMTNEKMIQIIENTIQLLGNTTDCADPSCNCEGNDTVKDTVIKLLEMKDELRKA